MPFLAFLLMATFATTTLASENEDFAKQHKQVMQKLRLVQWNKATFEKALLANYQHQADKKQLAQILKSLNDTEIAKAQISVLADGIELKGPNGPIQIKAKSYFEGVYLINDQVYDLKQLPDLKSRLAAIGKILSTKKHSASFQDRIMNAVGLPQAYAESNLAYEKCTPGINFCSIVFGTVDVVNNAWAGTVTSTLVDQCERTFDRAIKETKKLDLKVKEFDCKAVKHSLTSDADQVAVLNSYIKSVKNQYSTSCSLEVREVFYQKTTCPSHAIHVNGKPGHKHFADKATELCNRMAKVAEQCPQLLGSDSAELQKQLMLEKRQREERERHYNSDREEKYRYKGGSGETSNAVME